MFLLWSLYESSSSFRSPWVGPFGLWLHGLSTQSQFALKEKTFTTLRGEYKAKQSRRRKLGVLPKFQSKNFLKTREYPSVDNSEGKKRLHGDWTAWFIVKRFTVVYVLYARSNIYHYTAKLRRLLCHRFVRDCCPLTNWARKPTWSWLLHWFVTGSRQNVRGTI